MSYPLSLILILSLPFCFFLSVPVSFLTYLYTSRMLWHHLLSSLSLHLSISLSLTLFIFMSASDFHTLISYLSLSSCGTISYPSSSDSDSDSFLYSFLHSSLLPRTENLKISFGPFSPDPTHIRYVPTKIVRRNRQFYPPFFQILIYYDGFIRKHLLFFY